MLRGWAVRVCWLGLVVALLAAGGVSPARATDPPRGDRLHVGVYLDEIDATAVTAVSAWGGGTPLTFTGLFHHVDEAGTTSRLEAAWAAQTTPISNVLYYDTAQSLLDGRNSRTGQPNDIDARIAEWAAGVEQFLAAGGGRSLVIAPLPEMNGTWTAYGCTPSGRFVAHGDADYRAAFRKFRDLVTAELGPELAASVRWAFAPDSRGSGGCRPMADYYPGGDAVDIIGLSAFNVSGVQGQPWRDPAAVLQGPLDQLRATVDDRKPYLVTQTASPSAGGDKNAWILDLFDFLAADPNVVGFVWFNIDDAVAPGGPDVDWSCCPDDRYPAWQAGMALPATRYEWPLAWFGSGPLTYSPVPGGPAARADDIEVDEGGTVTIEVLANDGDPNLDALTLAVVSPPAHGTATARPDGTVVYRHDASETTLDVFAYVVTDGRHTAAATVSVSVRQRPDEEVGLVDPSLGRWHLRTADGSARSFFFGEPGDLPMLGDWDCDGVDTPGLYRPKEGTVYLRNRNTPGLADVRFSLGEPGDVPLAGDFDGDGCDTVSIYRPATGQALISNHLDGSDGGPGPAYFLGRPGDQPFAGDFDGDGVTTLGLHRASNGLLYLRQSHTAGRADVEFVLGNPGDRVVAGDWTGDGVDAVGLFRPGDASFYLRSVAGSGAADEVIPLGSGSWLPVAGAP